MISKTVPRSSPCEKTARKNEKTKDMITEFQWKTDDNLTIYAKDWSVAAPKAVFCLIHGMGEHVNRYNHVAEFLNSKGIALIGNDHRGHGQSGGTRGHFRKYEDYLDEVDVLIAEARKRYPGIPLVLYGHSKGGNITLNYLIRRKPEVDAAMVTGPWIELSMKASSVKIALGKMMRRILPSLTMPSGLPPSYVSSNPQVAKDYETDPYVHDKVSAEGGMGMFDSARFLAEYSGPMPYPLLIMHGGTDKVTSQPASEAFAGRLTGDVTYKVFPDLYHEIHNEVQQQEVFDYLYNWVKGKIAV